jgi:hypothetical protein
MRQTKPLILLIAIVGLLLIASGVAVMVLGQGEPAQITSTERPPTSTVEPTPFNLTPLPSTISGIVESDRGVLAGAIVQIQGSPVTTETDENGAFTLSGISGTTPIVLTAWRSGHYIGWMTVNPSAADWAGGDAIRIMLNRVPVGDNPEYEWFVEEGVRGSASCGLCHREYPEWQADAHSQSASNPRFISMYQGTDVNGQMGPTTQYDSQGIPVPLDPETPYFGPGFKLDNYNRAGNCASCHTPLASQAPNNQNCAWSGCHTDLTIERSYGVIPAAASPMVQRASEGITCEFCHKISQVFTDEETGLPFPDMPGIMSVRLHRPREESQQVFFGTLVDVTRNDSYLPFLSESAFCSSCHFGVFGGVVGMERVADGTTIYNSYGEWLNSPYSDPESGATCQDCHMPQSDSDWFVFAERGGLSRDYVTLHNHTMLGASDETLLQNAVTMETSAEWVDGQVQVEVSITNDRTGHHVPTDAPMRSLILVVEVRDADGTVLQLLEGSVNPDFSGDYAGVAGQMYAKVLRDDLTGETPTSAFWRPVTIVEDNRIAAMATDTTSYTFAAPDNQNVTVHVRLLYRRAFYELANLKGWHDPDIVMEEATINLSGE